MKAEKLFVLILSLVIISSVSVTANIQIKQDIISKNKQIYLNDPAKKIRDKIIPDITNYTSTWIDYENSNIKETKDISDLYYYLNPDQTTTYLSETVDLTSLIIQITESTVTNYIQSLVDFGPRRTGTQACNDAGNYIASVFSAMGLNVRIQQWSASGYSGNNIEATIVGENASSNEVFLVVAHYDTVSSSPGADDNAAGTAAVLASAQVMSNYMFSNTVKFVAFDGEEQGLLGSSVYAAEAASQGINIVEVLDADMIAYAETEQDKHTVEIYGSSDNIALESQAINSAYPGLMDLTVIPYGASGNSDHWPFIEEGYDAAMYSEYHFNPYYHSSQDTMDKLDLEYDSRVTRMIMAVLANYSELIIPDDGGGGGGQYILRPSVNIEDPSNGDYIRGTVDITGKASDIYGFVKYVLVQIDNGIWEYAKIDQTQGNYINWTYSWDTTNIDDGSHLISAICVNNHGADSPTYYSRVNVVNEVLVAGIIMPDQADVDEMITISSSIAGGLPPYEYIWDLGDGVKKYEPSITYVYNTPGEYNVQLTVKDSMNNSAHASKTILIVDQIPPTVSIINPKNAFYLNNNELFVLKNPVIIGDININLDADDNSGINFVTLYINNQEKYIFTQEPYVWTWDEKIFGKATIKVVAFDKSGNKANDTIEVWKFF